MLASLSEPSQTGSLGLCIVGSISEAPPTSDTSSSKMDLSNCTSTSICSLSPRSIASICTHLRLLGAPQSLAHLARTSHLFHDAALDALWHTIRSLVPLLYTFPSDLCSIHPIGSPGILRVSKIVSAIF